MKITQKQLLGFITIIALAIYYLITYDYLIVKLGSKWTDKKKEVPPPPAIIIPEESIETPDTIIPSAQQNVDLDDLSPEDAIDTLLTPREDREPTKYELELEAATAPVAPVLDFPSASGEERFINNVHL